jgi:homoserine dehydrogenase
MFSFGEDFDSCLKDAQEKGYAERNPDADILGIDASRKIAILGALISDKLIPTDRIHTEGITKIRSEDVKCAESLSYTIKLVGRCIIDDFGKSFIMVSPFMLPTDSPLSGVSGVYNAVEVIGEPIGSVMFYGQGAGAGATASAVVGDLMQAMRSGVNIKMPVMEKSCENLVDFSEFVTKSYIAVTEGDKEIIKSLFGEVSFIAGEELAFITPEMSEGALDEAISALTKAGITVKSRIRLL